MSTSSKWLKIIITLQYNFEDHVGKTWNLVTRLEEAFSIPMMYFARYSDLQSRSMEISLFTDASPNVLQQFCRNHEGVKSVKVEERGEGSKAHAFAYQMVKSLPPFAKDLADDNDFLDVLHWSCNMRGLDYLREARLFAYRTLSITHQVSLESDRNLDILRKFNAQVQQRATASLLTERLNLAAEKGQAAAKARVPSRSRRKKRSARAASRKGRGPRRAGSAG